VRHADVVGDRHHETNSFFLVISSATAPIAINASIQPQRVQRISATSFFLTGIVALLLATVLQGDEAEPQCKPEDGQERDQIHEPVAGVSDDQDPHHAVFAWERSHRASVVKPTITISSQYCERTAMRGLS